MYTNDNFLINLNLSRVIWKSRYLSYCSISDFSDICVVDAYIWFAYIALYVFPKFLSLYRNKYLTFDHRRTVFNMYISIITPRIYSSIRSFRKFIPLYRNKYEISDETYCFQCAYSENRISGIWLYTEISKSLSLCRNKYKISDESFISNTYIPKIQISRIWL